MNRRHMIDDHHGRMAGRATLLVRAVDEILGTHKCLDPMLITGERHLRLVLSEYTDHCNTHRSHRTLHQNPPAGRADPAAAATNIRVLRRDRLGGLIREYAQVA